MSKGDACGLEAGETAKLDTADETAKLTGWQGMRAYI
jgi:hypothetical protein